MRVFKTTYKARDGRTEKARKWYIEVRDHLAIARRFPAFTDKGQSESLGRQIERLIVCRVSGQQPDMELTRWLEHVPRSLLDRFVGIGLLDRDRAVGSKSLSQHLDDFAESLRRGKSTDKHVDQTAARVRSVLEGCGFFVWSDIRAERVEQYLVKLRSNGLSIQTSNYYLAALQSFARWMVRNHRATESPVAHLRRLNSQTDRRHDRRALEVDEVRRLLASTEAASERYGMTGPERALLYRLAIETGLRANELRSLTAGSFDLSHCTVTVLAGYSKHRREDVLPLRPDTAASLKVFLAGKLPGAKAFGGRYRDLTDKTSKMIEADLAEAGIQYVDTAGRYADMHSLRHTCGSWLAANGVHPKIAQVIMRHSDINLTMSRYTHTLHGQEAEAVAKLPDLSLPDRQAQRATGTDGRAVDGGFDLASRLAPPGVQACISAQAGAKQNRVPGVENAVLNEAEGARTLNLRIDSPML
jgi:integrase